MRPVLLLVLTATLLSCSAPSDSKPSFDSFEELAITLGINPNSCQAKNFCLGSTYMSIEDLSSKLGISMDDWEKSADANTINYKLSLNQGMEVEISQFSSGLKQVSAFQSRE